MKYTITRGTTTVIEVHAEGQVTERMLGEQLVDATFSLPNKIEFQLWDSIEVDGKTYYLHTTPTEEKLSNRNFRYTLQFAGVKYFLANTLCFFPDKNNNLTLSEYSITGTAQQILSLIVQNANREQSGWTVGTVATEEARTVDFNGHTCLSALSKMSEAFDLEYWVDADKSIHLEERKQVSGYSFEYGKNKGLKSITRLPVEGTSIVTRLYAEGGAKNLKNDYRNYKKRLQMPVPYLERNVAKYGVIEAIQHFDDIYPHRTGKVTAVDAQNPLIFIDNTMPFDLNAKDAKGNTTILINKVSAKVTFNTGQLAGYTFEIKDYGYNHSKKTFELLKNANEKDMEVPSELLRPAVGDEYVITDIMMPQSYVDVAESELQTKAQEYLNKNSEQRNVYEVVADPIYFSEQNVNVQIGHTCLFTDTDFGLSANLRVLGVVKNLQNLYEMQFELGETTTVVRIIREYFKAEKQATELRKYLKYNAEEAKRSYEFAREIADNVFDNEGYFDSKKIKPLSIETKLLTVGSRSQQFNLTDVVLTVSEKNTAVRNTAGDIIHLTVADKPRTWNIAENVQRNIADGFHYIYVKAQRDGTNASVLVSQERMLLEQDENYWHFEAGYLGSINEGFRRIKLVHGFTQVSPGEIVTGRIASANGANYIDILEDKICIKADVEFSSGTSLEDWAKKQENAVDEKIDALKVREVNLLNNYNDFSKWVVENGVNISNNGSLSTNKKGTWGIYQGVLVNKGTNYTLSLKSTNRKGLRVSVGAGDKIWKGIITYTAVEKDFFVLKFNSGEHTKVRIYLSMHDSGSSTLVSAQLEEGTEATAHGTSEADRKKRIILLDYIKDAFQKTTEVLGGIVFTSLLALKNKSGKVTAYLNGNSSSNNNAFAAGVENFGKNNETSKTSITHDGKLRSKQAEIEGEIVARKGKIGDFRIEGDSLKSGDFRGSSGGLGLDQRGVIFRRDINKVFAGFGENVFAPSTGLKGHLRIENKGPRAVVGAMIEVRPTGMYWVDASKALIIDGNTKKIGGHCKYDDTYIGIAHTDTITLHIGVTHQFLFTGIGGSYISVKLPSKSEIGKHTGGKDVTFLLEITMGVGTSGKSIKLEGVYEGVMRNSDGGVWDGPYGYVHMSEGDVLTLRYHNGNYYLVNWKK